MNTEKLKDIRRQIAALSTKLISVARPGHVAYISKVDAGHALARIENEIDSLLTAYQTFSASGYFDENGKILPAKTKPPS